MRNAAEIAQFKIGRRLVKLHKNHYIVEARNYLALRLQASPSAQRETNRMLQSLT